MNERILSRPLGRGTAVLLAAFFLFSFLPADAFARGGFKGGGFRSMPSMRSVPRISMPRVSVPRAATPSAASAGRSGGRVFTWGSSTRPAAAAATGAATGAVLGSSGSGGNSAPRFANPLTGGRTGVAAQRSIYDNARRNGTVFSGKTEAAQSFKSKYSGQYGSNFASEPASRPGHIPASTRVNGQNVNIVYNPALGGYGYMHPLLGTWMLYDAMADAVMLDSLMGGHGYYWGRAPIYASHGSNFLGIAIALFVLFFAFVAITTIARRRWSRDRDS